MTAETAESTAVPRPAATVILVRRGRGEPSVLMGQRGAGAAFMPSKYVFPGGAVDKTDRHVPLAAALGARCATRIAADDADLAAALAAAAVRELWEETGLALARPGNWRGGVPESWADFASAGLLPDAGALRFFFRAITPPGRPRRFDARFLVADARSLVGDLDDFSRASDELSHLHWVALSEATKLSLPFITEVVLAEVQAYLAEISEGDALPVPASVPFFDNSGPVPTFRRIA